MKGNRFHLINVVDYNVRNCHILICFKIPVFLHTCAMRSEIPSNISIIGPRGD